MPMPPYPGPSTLPQQGLPYPPHTEGGGGLQIPRRLRPGTRVRFRTSSGLFTGAVVLHQVGSGSVIIRTDSGRVMSVPTNTLQLY
ncbi:hypothetical protein FH5_00557 [Priestia endophytica]|nr:hypothetical protein FH5_00557 [Priestia endophytica]